MRHSLSALLLLAVLSALCLMAPVPARAATYPMAGVWFGTGQPNERRHIYNPTIKAEGTIHTQNRECRQGKIASEIKETGRWSVKGDMLSIDIATVNGTPDPRTDLYRLIAVDAKSQNYVYLRTNFAYHAHKVAGDFAMPPCDLTS